MAVPAPSFAVASALPAGLVFTDYGDGTASISGTPALDSGGLYPVTVTVDNGTATPSSQTLEITVFGPPSITSPSSEQVVDGSPANVTVTTAGWPYPALSMTGSLPSGLSFADNGNGTASITGTPSPGLEGTYQVQVQASNGTPSGYSATQALTIAVAVAPTITSPDQVNFADGKSSSVTVTAAGWPAPTVSIVGALPPGLTATSGTAGTTTISGTPHPNDAGNYRVTVKANNGAGSAAEQTLTIYAAPASSASSAGYDLAGSDGGVFVFPVGQASGFFGSLPGLGVKVTNVVGIVPTNNFSGYNLVGSDGGVFVFPVGQCAGFFGSPARAGGEGHQHRGHRAHQQRPGL